LQRHLITEAAAWQYGRAGSGCAVDRASVAADRFCLGRLVRRNARGFTAIERRRKSSLVPPVRRCYP